MKQTKSRKTKSLKAKKPTSAKKSIKWGVFVNSHCVVGPFEGDETGDWEATCTYSDKACANAFVAGATEARRHIFMENFGGDTQIDKWVACFETDLDRD